jgi:hypothetical protein
MPENNLVHLMDKKQLQSSIDALIPKAKRFIDPFFPGLGFVPVEKFDQLIFNLSDENLMEFITKLRTPGILNEIKSFQDTFPLLNQFGNEVTEELKVAINDYIDNNINAEDLSYMVRVIVVMNIDNPQFAPLFNEKFIVYLDRFIDAIEHGLLEVSSQVKIQGQFVTKNLNDLVNGALITAFYNHWLSIIKSYNTSKTPVLSGEKLLTINFISAFLGEQSLLYRLKSNLFCYKNDLVNCFREVLSFLNHIPHTNSSFFNLSPISFLTDLKTSANDFILIDEFASGNNLEIEQIVDLAIKKNLKILYLHYPASSSSQNPYFVSWKLKNTFDLGSQTIELFTNY